MILLIGMATAIICSVVGDFFLKRGAGQIATPAIEAYGGIRGLLNPLKLYGFLRQSHFFHWKLGLGVAILSVYFAGYLTALNKGSVTLVVPLMSLTQILNTLIGKYILREPVTRLRWAGVIVVVIGVVLLSVFRPSGH